MAQERLWVGILSDTHGRGDLAARAAELLAARQVDRVFHCGDIGDESVIDALLNLNVTYVFGNTDHFRVALRRYIEIVGGTVAEPYFRTELAGKRIACIHGDDRVLLGRLIDSQDLDYVFHGHTHQTRSQHVGRTHVINPGAVYRAAVPTVAVLDVLGDELEFIPLHHTAPQP